MHIPPTFVGPKRGYQVALPPNLLEIPSYAIQTLEFNINNLQIQKNGESVDHLPFRVAFFVWTVILENILTIDNLRKRQILILDWCCMCKRNMESVDHHLTHCSIAFDVWSMVFTLFGIHQVMLKMVVELLACWQGKLV